MNFLRNLDALKKRLGIRVDVGLFSGEGFLTWHRRPKFPSSLVSPGRVSALSNIGIVIQGPILQKHDFTLETARLYRKIYPNVPIVVSTWSGSGYRKLSELNEIGVKLIELEDVGPSLLDNLERQRATTLAGIGAMKSEDVAFVLKTRSDQRIYNPDFLGVLGWQLSRFLPRSTRGSVSPIARLMFVSANSFINRPFSVSDFLTFGTTADSLMFWEPGDFDHEEGLVPEQKLLLGYLRKLGMSFSDLSLEAWLGVLKNLIGIVDANNLDLFWHKYSLREYLWRRYQDGALEEITFQNWLMLISDHDQYSAGN